MSGGKRVRVRRSLRLTVSDSVKRPKDLDGKEFPTTFPNMAVSLL